MAATDKRIDMLLALEGGAGRGSRADLLARALRTAGPLVDADAAVIVLGHAHRPAERLVLHAGSDLPAHVPLGEEGSEALRRIAGTREPIALPDLSDVAAFATGDACPGVEAGPVLFAPLAGRAGGEPSYLAIHRRRGRAKFTLPETQLLLLLAAWLSAALERETMAARARKQSATDEQTEAWTERFVQSTLRREMRRAHRHGQELSIVLVHPDATAGGEADDPATLRRELSALLAGHVRSFDALGRRGEEGFVLVLPQTGSAGASEVAERVRAAVEAHAFAPGGAGSVTATLAVATFPHDGMDADALGAVAERVLAEAKGRGGNRVATTARRAA